MYIKCKKKRQVLEIKYILYDSYIITAKKRLFVTFFTRHNKVPTY